MNEVQKAAIAAIEKQQKELTKPDTAPWMVGEQLKEICEAEPSSAALIRQDLEVKEMSIVEAEKKIKAYADKHRSGNSACVSPKVAEGILREFYGMGKREDTDSSTSLRSAQNDRSGGGSIIDLAEFL